ncbi:hypothetical protein ABMB67_000137 [Halalkalibacter oceani]
MKSTLVSKAITNKNRSGAGKINATGCFGGVPEGILPFGTLFSAYLQLLICGELIINQLLTAFRKAANKRTVNRHFLCYNDKHI